MVNLTTVAREHLDAEEVIKFKVLGMLDGKVEGEAIVRNGIFIATNRRILFFNKKQPASFIYENISNVEFIEKKLNSPTIKFQYNNKKISIKYIDQGDVTGFLGLLKKEQSEPEEKPTTKATQKVEEKKEKITPPAPKQQKLNEKKPFLKRWWVWVVAGLF